MSSLFFKQSSAINHDVGSLNYNNSMLVSYLNINSYRNKHEHFKDQILPGNLDIFCITETKLDASFPDAQFAIENYRMFRCDKTKHAGGLLAHVRSDIPCRRLSDFSTQHVELLLLELNRNLHK